MLLSRRRQLTGPKQAIKIGANVVEEVVYTGCFGVQIDNAFKWDQHILELARLELARLELAS